LFLQQAEDIVPAHPPLPHASQSASEQRRQIFVPQQIPSPAGGGLPFAQSHSGAGVPEDPPDAPPEELPEEEEDVVPPSP
jgi:hypothetical protein